MLVVEVVAVLVVVQQVLAVVVQAEQLVEVERLIQALVAAVFKEAHPVLVAQV
jgi:hypothetical protein